MSIKVIVKYIFVALITGIGAILGVLPKNAPSEFFEVTTLADFSLSSSDLKSSAELYFEKPTEVVQSTAETKLLSFNYLSETEVNNLLSKAHGVTSAHLHSVKISPSVKDKKYNILIAYAKP